MAKSIYSYVVRYDSGFAPNPFFGYCTLATCKPQIRRTAQVGDWIVGTGSADKKINRGGHLVFAMQVSEVLTTAQYWRDERFKRKRPNLYGSWMISSGDNIYEPLEDGKWGQLNSFHSKEDGSQRKDHTEKDTRVERILVSERFVYFGAEGNRLPSRFMPSGRFPVVMEGRSYRRNRSPDLIEAFEAWFDCLPETGLKGKPWDWVHRGTHRGFSE